MEKHLEKLSKNPLFNDLNMEELKAMLLCLSARAVSFEKNSYIFTEGSENSNIGIVISGRVHIIKDDYWGNRTILAEMGASDMFGEAFCFAGVKIMPVSVIALENTGILLFDYKRILNTCAKTCSYHTKLISNMVGIISRKNMLLTQKMQYITQKKTRDKLLSYLSAQSELYGNNKFDIPFNRQELADYLSVERSAMSNELCKMRDENLIDFHKNHFHLY